VHERIQCAVENNAQWCDLVCRSKRIETSWQDGFWITRQPSPQFYPEGMTLRENVAPDRLINELPRGLCSVKDSFSDLDLASYGFERLFDARWIDRSPVPSAAAPTGWTVVSTEEAFAQWRDRCGLADVLPGELLREESVRVLQRERAKEVVAGAVLNRTGVVVGLSNVFSLDVPLDEVWADLVALSGQQFSSCPIVGYARDEDLTAAIATGFEDLAQLTVWLQMS